MKRITALILVLTIAASLAGCTLQDYRTAGTLYKEGK